MNDLIPLENNIQCLIVRFLKNLTPGNKISNETNSKQFILPKFYSFFTYSYTFGNSFGQICRLEFALCLPL